MSLPYAYTPRPGEVICVGGGSGDYGHASIATAAGPGTHGTVNVPAADVPVVAAGIATAMHEAAGLPVPVILERPEITFKDGPNRAGSIEVGRLRDRVTVGLYGIQPEELEHGDALRLAALIAIRAAEVQRNEPDPAEVEDLACVIARYRKTTVSDGHDHGIARAVLRHQRDKKQQRGEQP